MAVFLNGILYARNLPLTPEIALFIAAGSLTPEFTVGEELFRPFEDEDSGTREFVERETRKDPRGLSPGACFAQAAQRAEHTEAADDQGADTAPPAIDQSPEAHLNTLLSNDPEFLPARLSDQCVSSPYVSEVNQGSADLAGQELNTVLTDGESILLECLGNTENPSEPLPSIEDLFDFHGYESSTTEISVSSRTGASERESSYCTSVTAEEYSEEQPEKGQYRTSKFANSRKLTMLSTLRHR